MQRLARLSFCFLVPLCVHAQAGKKEANAPAATKKNGSATPAAPEKGTFSDNIVAVFRKVQASGLAGAKGEFESTAQYQARLASWKGDTKRYVFVVDQDENLPFFLAYYTFDYDADSEEMHLTVGANNLIEESIEVRSVHTLLGTYVGANAFGVKKIITRVAEETYRARLSSSSPFKLFGKTEYGSFEPAKFTWTMGPSAARANKASLRIALVGTVPSPDATEEEGLREPTLDDPRQTLISTRTLPFSLEELRVLNLRTGATVASFPPK